MSRQENEIYIKYLEKAKKEHLPNEQRISLFKKLIPLYINGAIDHEEFGHIVGNLYFKEEWIGIGENNTVLDWLMNLGADAAFQKGDYKKKLELYYLDPDKFNEWCKKNKVKFVPSAHR